MADELAGELASKSNNSEVELQYHAIRPKYEKLATEVEYVIKEALAEERIPIASVSKRTKSVASFADKIRRKTYAAPLEDITDLAGIRIVCYFRGDLPRLEYVIRRSFHVVEKVNKSEEMEVDRFGYMAVQFIATINNNYLGPRYDDVKGLKCEIQTRAVLADAWAILDHYLLYNCSFRDFVYAMPPG
jgi:putative GTP pyrophosphokinase